MPAACVTPDKYYVSVEESGRTSADNMVEVDGSQYIFSGARSDTEYRIRVSTVSESGNITGNGTDILYRTSAYGLTV